MSSKKHKRYKLLLDEGLHLPTSYPNLNNLHDVVHVAETSHRGQDDEIIFRIAGKEKRIPVVFNTKHFKPLIFSESVSVISLSTNLTDKQADLKMCKALRGLKGNETKGHLITITNTGISIKRIVENESGIP